MKDEILEKQISESRLYDIDFTDLLVTGDTVTGVTSIIAAPATLTVGTPTFATPLVQVRLSGGTLDVTYVLTAIATTLLGNTLETDVRLRIID